MKTKIPAVTVLTKKVAAHGGLSKLHCESPNCHLAFRPGRHEHQETSAAFLQREQVALHRCIKMLLLICIKISEMVPRPFTQLGLLGCCRRTCLRQVNAGGPYLVVGQDTAHCKQWPISRVRLNGYSKHFGRCTCMRTVSCCVSYINIRLTRYPLVGHCYLLTHALHL